jgi:hypothetical protein
VSRDSSERTCRLAPVAITSATIATIGNASTTSTTRVISKFSDMSRPGQQTAAMIVRRPAKVNGPRERISGSQRLVSAAQGKVRAKDGAWFAAAGTMVGLPPPLAGEGEATGA